MANYFRNSEGYSDFTAGRALLKMEREERAKRRAKHRRRPKTARKVGEKISPREDEKYAWEEMANAIIIQAAQDWREAKRILRSDPDNRDAAQTVAEAEAFFLSEYYSALTTCNGKTLLNRLRKEFEDDEL